MLGDALVVDAVVHPYDLGAANRDPAAAEQLEAVYGAHRLATGPDHPEHLLTREEFFADFPYAALSGALFVESPVDLAILHALPNLGFARGNVTDPDRAAAERDRHPHRYRLYATVDTPVTDAAIAQLERQVRELGVDGLKLYPAFFHDGIGEGWRLDGPDYATPLLEAARDLGVRTVAVHKALWLPPAPRSAFDVDDLDGALERFADLDFLLVHAGAAFLDRTAELMARHGNVYATLESVFTYVVVRPEAFARVLGRLLAAAGADRLLYGSGANLSHPAPLLAAFAGYQLPDEHPQLTDADRRAILGGTALRLHGIDAAAARAATADDGFARLRAAGAGARPWAGLRS